ncbi:hypothetical protein [Rufibacter roseus]|uniref:VWA domain-containing protein n=1 Tax=Rufibacter roseus TaxID=1567108 RepID=A0ABW2DEU4_9BACT|nr:hypothetical protein [Rufibacter roseus]
MNLPLPLLLTLALLLDAWLTWLTVRRDNRRWLLGRLLTCWGIVACLVFLVHPPKVDRTYSASEAVLLTQGFSPDTLKALLADQSPAPQVFSFEAEHPKAISIKDFSAFQQEQPSVKILHVLGYGLELEELQALKQMRMIPHLSALPAGVLSAGWPQEVALGEELRVQGRFHSADKPVQLYLNANGVNRDSVEFQQRGEHEFTLQFTPKAVGQYVYHLQWKEANDSIFQEEVPVSVLPPRRLNVLLLSSAPSFETRFLKNELARQGHGVAVRNQVSKGIYQTESINLPSRSLNRLSDQLLQKFDLVLLDASTLQSLSTNETKALQHAAREQGLGILTSFSDNNPKTISFFAEASFDRFSKKELRNRSLQWKNSTGGTAELTVPAFTIQPKEGHKVLVWENQQQNRVVAAQYRKGLGMVGISLATETFPLALAGKEHVYRQFWSDILSSLAKPAAKLRFLTAGSLAPVQVHEPAYFFSSKPVDSVSLVGQATTSSLPAPYPSSLPKQLIQQHWPNPAGWNIAYSRADSIGTFYTSSPSNWPLLKIQQKKARFLASATNNASPLDEEAIVKQEAINLWPVYFLLLFFLAFLWLEEKL